LIAMQKANTKIILNLIINKLNIKE
jgi:hypothetical protein